MSDVFEELGRALRGPADERLERLGRVAERVRAVAPHPISMARSVLDRLGDRWSSLLLSLLAADRCRHNELHRLITLMSRLAEDETISRRMLMHGLRVLERDGLVSRCVGTGNAPAVEYRLTPLGVSVERKLAAVIDWSIEHTETLRKAQQDFDQREALPADTLRHRLR